MSITSIISAIGNNSSIYPLLVRDCGIEVPSKVYLTYKENKNDKEIQKLATRERFIDEYVGSAIWLGGIPLMDAITNKIIKKNGFNPDINLKLLKEEDAQGLEYNIKKFADKAPEAVEELKKLRTQKAQNTYKAMLGSKFIAATTIPIAIIGFILPKLIFASSAKKIAELKKQKAAQENNSNTSNPTTAQSQKNKKTSFKGNFMSTLANFSTKEKMEVIDGGYAAGRILTARKGPDGNRNEAKDIAFKMAGMMYLNYVAPEQIEKIMNKATLKAFKLNVNLDPIMLADNEFLKAVKDGKLKLPKSDNAKDMLDFIDNNPDSLFTKYADKFEKIKMLNKDVRDPRAYVNIKKLAEFKNSIEEFAKSAIDSNQIDKFAKRAKNVKTFNILANVGLSSFLLAYCLPKAQFAFRRLVTGSELEPGIVNANMKK